MPAQKSSQHILIIRLSAIGDVIMATGLITALRKADPEVRIAWLTEDVNADLLREHPRLERVFLLPRRRWQSYFRQRLYLKLWRELRALVRELRAEKFDLVLDLQGLLRSGVWAGLSGGRRSIGLGSKEGSQLLMSEVVDRQTEDPRLGSEYRKLALTLGASDADFAMDIAVAPSVRMGAEELLLEQGVRGEFAVIAPFTTRPQKHWFDERWIELAARLKQEFGLTVVMLGGPGDKEHADAIAGRSPGMVNLVGLTGLGHCAAIVEKAALAIGVDTGLTHLGIAMKTPTLALFGSTRPYLDADVKAAKVLYEPMACSPCRRRPSCGGEFPCMKAHTVDQVIYQAGHLLGKSA